MPLTVRELYGKSAKAPSEHPQQYIKLIEVDFDDNYPAGGEALTFDQPVVAAWHVDGGSYVYRYNRATGKIQAFKAVDTDGISPDGTLVEETAATDLSSETGILFAVLVDQT